MELIYLYIEDGGKNLKDCEFNFSPEYRISYNRNKNLINVKNNETYIPNFWEANNISNVTAIIGKNGAGKSNLLEFIFRFYSDAFGFKDIPIKNFIHIYKLKGSLYINREDINSNYEFRIKHYIQYPLNIFKNDVETKLLYYSTHYEKDILFDLGSGIISMDISTGGLLRKYGNDRKYVNKTNTFSDIDRLLIEDTFRQLDLLRFSSTVYFKDIQLPKSLNITFKEGSNRLKSDNILYNKLFIDKPLWELDFTEHITNRFLYFIFKDQDYISTLKIAEDSTTFDDFIKKTYAAELYFELIKLYHADKILFKKYPQNIGLRLDYMLTFGVKREDISFDLYIGLYYYYFKEIVYSDPRSLDSRRIVHNDLVLSWQGLSAGELEYLNFLSRIYTSINEVIIDHGKRRKIQAKPNNFSNIILLLDEPENSFHPEWQRLLMDNLLHFLNKSMPFYTFQIIIASHSPVLISDFPKDNIIFLDKNEIDGSCKVVDSISRDNTFGANIHTLYRNSFFIDGLPIGEFAKKKINKLFDELENEQIVRSSILKEIQMIGEPILRDQLMKLYKQREGMPEDVTRRISELEKEISILRRRLND